MIFPERSGVDNGDKAPQSLLVPNETKERDLTCNSVRVRPSNDAKLSSLLTLASSGINYHSTGQD